MTTTTTSPVLKKGSQGAAVKELQTLLNLRFGYPSIGEPLVVDGIFGSATESRVKIAQYRYMLPQDGIVSALVWQALRANAAPIAAKPILRRGSTGVDVQIAQGLLRDVGFYKSAIDQIFGPNTEAAVRKFQQSGQLQVDGIIGPKTWKALESVATFHTFD